MTAIIVFPGQGAQKNGMGKDFYEAFAQARAVFDEAAEALGLNMATLCFENDDRLNLTEFTQPAIMTTEIAMFEVLKAHFGVQPSFFGGHSLGEYTALVAAGVIPLSEGVQIVRERGRRMQQAVAPDIGSMAAIIQPELRLGDIQAVLEGLNADIANHNALNQIVISGEANDVATAAKRYQNTPSGARARIRMLTVSAPFHSHLMAPIEADFKAFLTDSSTGWTTGLSAQVASNTSGQMHDGDASGLVDRLTRQISSTVLWVDNMHTLLGCAPHRILEVGPARPLRGFFRSLADAMDQRPLDAVTNLTSARHALSA